MKGLWPLTLAVALFVVGCDPDTPEFRHYEEIVQTCARDVEQEPTGGIRHDLVGTWRLYAGGSDHPLDLGIGQRLYLLQEDGTGHYWYAYKGPGHMGGGEAPLTWRIEDGNLVVNDRPPVSVEFTPHTARIWVLDDQRNRFDDDVVTWSRCEGEFPNGLDI